MASFPSSHPLSAANRFRIYTGEAFFWTMNDILKESQIHREKF